MSLGNTNVPFFCSGYKDIAQAISFHNLSNNELKMMSPSNGNLQPVILIDDNKKTIHYINGHKTKKSKFK